MKLSRRILSISVRFQSNITCEEVRIPVPWGHLAGKWWGPQEKRPILSIHGWQENAGTFNRLIPLLPRKVGYLAIDLPGHGFSSRLPAGMFYSGTTDIISIRLIKEYFNWDKVSLMAHSSGGMTSYTYGFIHPDDVDFIIAIDAMQWECDPTNNITYRKQLELFIKQDKHTATKIEPSCYSLNDLAYKFHIRTDRSIDLDFCKHILERNILPAEDKPGFYCVNADPRLKCYHFFNWNCEYHRRAVKLVNFPILLAIIYRKEYYLGQKLYSLEDLIGASEFFESHKLEGTHHAHLNNPELFAGLITEFIKKHDTNDRSWMFNMNRIKE